MSKAEAAEVTRSALEGDMGATQRLVDSYSALQQALDNELRYKRGAQKKLSDAISREESLKGENKQLAAQVKSTKTDAAVWTQVYGG